MIIKSKTGSGCRKSERLSSFPYRIVEPPRLAVLLQRQIQLLERYRQQLEQILAAATRVELL